MAEFCVDCWNEINDSNYTSDSFILSEYLDLCEGCGEYKNIIIKIRKIDRKEFIFKYIIAPLVVLWRILTLPYTIYKYIKTKKGTENQEGLD